VGVLKRLWCSWTGAPLGVCGEEDAKVCHGGFENVPAEGDAAAGEDVEEVLQGKARRISQSLRRRGEGVGGCRDRGGSAWCEQVCGISLFGVMRRPAQVLLLTLLAWILSSEQSALFINDFAALSSTCAESDPCQWGTALKALQTSPTRNLSIAFAPGSSNSIPASFGCALANASVLFLSLFSSSPSNPATLVLNSTSFSCRSPSPPPSFDGIVFKHLRLLLSPAQAHLWRNTKQLHLLYVRVIAPPPPSPCAVISMGLSRLSIESSHFNNTCFNVFNSSIAVTSSTFSTLDAVPPDPPPHPMAASTPALFVVSFSTLSLRDSTFADMSVASLSVTSTPLQAINTSFSNIFASAIYFTSTAYWAHMSVLFESCRFDTIGDSCLLITRANGQIQNSTFLRCGVL
jgi:hypothetical protein